MNEHAQSQSLPAERVEMLSVSDFADVLDFQEYRVSNTASTTRARSSAYYQNLVTRQTGFMVGVRSNGKLVGHLGMTGPLELREAIALRIITTNDVLFPHAALTDSVLVLTHADVADDAPPSISHDMMAFALSSPLCQVTDHVFMRTSMNAQNEWPTLMAHGFGIVAAAYDMDGKDPHYVFQKPCFGFDFSPAIIADDVDPVIDFQAIVSLTQRDALVGRYEENSTQKLAFFRNREAINTMPTLAQVKALR